MNRMQPLTRPEVLAVLKSCQQRAGSRLAITLLCARDEGQRMRPTVAIGYLHEGLDGSHQAR